MATKQRARPRRAEHHSVSETVGASSVGGRARAAAERSVQLRYAGAGERLGCTHAAESQARAQRGADVRERHRMHPQVHTPCCAPTRNRGRVGRHPSEQPRLRGEHPGFRARERVGCPVSEVTGPSRALAPARTAGTRLKDGCSPRSGEGGGQGRRPFRPPTAQASPQRGRRASPGRPAPGAQVVCRSGTGRRYQQYQAITGN